MITALVSTVLGMVGGLLPDIFKEIRETREHDREMDRMQKTSDLQMRLLEKQGDIKLAEIDANSVVEEMRAFRAQMENIYKSQAPIGIKWVDAWNAALRPGAVTIIMCVFTLATTMYCAAVIQMWWDGMLGMNEAAQELFKGLVGEAIQATLGYLFGYRSARAVRASVKTP